MIVVLNTLILKAGPCLCYAGVEARQHIAGGGGDVRRAGLPGQKSHVSAGKVKGGFVIPPEGQDRRFGKARTHFAAERRTADTRAAEAGEDQCEAGGESGFFEANEGFRGARGADHAKEDTLEGGAARKGAKGVIVDKQDGAEDSRLTSPGFECSFHDAITPGCEMASARARLVCGQGIAV